MIISQFFENFEAWEFNNGIIYITGRDIICMVTGILIGILLILTVEICINRTDEK